MRQNSVARLRRKRRLRWLRWAAAVLLLLVVGGAAAWRHYLSPERLRAEAESQLTKLTGTKVQVGAASFTISQGILLQDVTIEDRQPGAGRPAIHAGAVRVKPVWSSAFTGELRLSTVDLEDVAVNAELDRSMRWPFLEGIRPAGKRPGTAPEIFIRSAELRLSAPQFPEVHLTQLSGSFHPEAGADAYDATVSCDDENLGRPHAAVRVLHKGQRIEGEFSADGLAIDPRLRAFLPEGARAVWDECAPSGGRLDVTSRFTWDVSRNPPAHVEGGLRLREAGFKHKLFPCALTDLKAEVRFEDRAFEIVRFRATAGTARLAGNGKGVLSPDGNATGQFSLRATGLEFDKALYEALPAEAKALWDRVKPQGAVNIAARIGLLSDGEPPELHANVTLKDCSFFPPELPAPLSRVNGVLVLSRRRVNLRRIMGRMGEAPFMVRDGVIPLEKDEAFQMAASVSDLPIDNRYLRFIPQATRERIPASTLEFIEKGELAGRLDVAASVRRERPGDAVRLDCDVAVKDLTFSHPKLMLPLTEVRTRVHFSDDVLELGPASARWGEARVEIPATRFGLAADAAKSLTLRIVGIPLDRRFHDIVPAWFRKQWDEYKMRGLVDIEAQLTRAEGADAPLRTNLAIGLRDGQVRYKGFPYPVRRIVGTVAIDDGAFQKAEFAGRNGGAEIHLAIYPDPYDGKPGRRFVLQTTSAPLDEDLYGALPPHWRALWDALKPAGAVKFRLEKRFPLDSGTTDVFNYSSEALFDDLSLNCGVPMQVKGGRITIENAVSDASGKVALSGNLHFDEMLIESVQLGDVNTAFQSPGEGLKIDGLTAECYEGTLTASLSIPETSGTPNGAAAEEIMGEVKLRHADVKKIADSTGITGFSGRLDANNTFAAALNRPDAFSAVGDMHIYDGAVGKFPGLLSVLNYLELHRLDAPPFHTVELSYEIKEGKVFARKINLIGNVLSLYGKGEVDADKQVNFRFVTEFGPQAIRIPWVQDMVNWIKGQVIPITVRGGYDDPVWQMNPALSLTRAIEGILSGLVPLRSQRPEAEPAKPPANGR